MNFSYSKYYWSEMLCHTDRVTIHCIEIEWQTMHWCVLLWHLYLIYTEENAVITNLGSLIFLVCSFYQPAQLPSTWEGQHWIKRLSPWTLSLQLHYCMLVVFCTINFIKSNPFGEKSVFVHRRTFEWLKMFDIYIHIDIPVQH